MREAGFAAALVCSVSAPFAFAAHEWAAAALITAAACIYWLAFGLTNNEKRNRA